jgi:SAM-dependent methyltransferase
MTRGTEQGATASTEPAPGSSMLRKRLKGESRTAAQIREHYLVERALADRLREAPAAQRPALYGEVYDELFRRVPHHPQVSLKEKPGDSWRVVQWQLRLLRSFLKAGSTFLEIGAGDCALSLAVCPFVKHAYAGDVSQVILEEAKRAENFTPLLLKGMTIPLPADSVDVVYSNQLLEHLHPDDTLEHLREVHAVLKRGGVYVGVTPNRVAGPWDISLYFDEYATGFHLKEYTLGELAGRLEEIGFRRVQCRVGARGWYIRSPRLPVQLLERGLARLPFSLRFPLARSLPMRALLGLRIVAVK